MKKNLDLWHWECENDWIWKCIDSVDLWPKLKVHKRLYDVYMTPYECSIWIICLLGVLTFLFFYLNKICFFFRQYTVFVVMESRNPGRNVIVVHQKWGLQQFKPFNDQFPSHIDNSQLICRENQLTGFYMMRTLVIKGLMKLFEWRDNLSRNIFLCFTL